MARAVSGLRRLSSSPVSRISKLWIQRQADKRTVFNWDRGADIPATDPTTKAIVDFLAGGLADYVYAE